MVVDLRKGDCRSKDDPAQNTSCTIALPHVSLGIQITQSNPKDDFHAVDDGVGFVASPSLEALDVRGEKLVEDEYEGFGRLFCGFE